MLYVYHGTDHAEVVKKGQHLVARLKERRPDAQVFAFEADGFEVALLDELVEAQGLFVERHIVVLKRLYEVADAREALMERLERLQASQNIFVVTEGPIRAGDLEVIKGYATKIEVCDASVRKDAPYNVFPLADALAARDRKKLWLGYHDARSAGVAIEAIHGMLAWAARTLIVAGSTGTPEEAGMKPFSYNKYAQYARNYSAIERVRLSRSLVVLYHEARRGNDTLEGALERFILTC